MTNERHIAAWAKDIVPVDSSHTGPGQDTISNPFGDDFPVRGDRVINPHANAHETAAISAPKDRQRDIGATGITTVAVAETPPKSQQGWDDVTCAHETAARDNGGIGFIGYA